MIQQNGSRLYECGRKCRLSSRCGRGWQLVGCATDFPPIQGADACGRIVAVGSDVDPSRIGERVLVRTIQPKSTSENPVACWTFGSECDGAFAEYYDYAVSESAEAYRVESELDDIQLASFPCAYSTAERCWNERALSRTTVCSLPVHRVG
jgi:NADPH:quinone reductase-like Zn-dependent oxidoreductase